jgi:hypothetical protein
MGGAIISESGGGIIPLQGGGIIPELGGGFLRNQHTLLSSTPKRPLTRRSGYASAHTNSARATIWTKPGSFMIPQLSAQPS